MMMLKVAKVYHCDVRNDSSCSESNCKIGLEQSAFETAQSALCCVTRTFECDTSRFKPFYFRFVYLFNYICIFISFIHLSSHKFIDATN